MTIDEMVSMVHIVHFMTTGQLFKKHAELAPNTKDVRAMAEAAMIIAELYNFNYHWNAGEQKWERDNDNEES